MVTCACDSAISRLTLQTVHQVRFVCLMWPSSNTETLSTPAGAKLVRPHPNHNSYILALIVVHNGQKHFVNHNPCSTVGLFDKRKPAGLQRLSRADRGTESEVVSPKHSNKAWQNNELEGAFLELLGLGARQPVPITGVHHLVRLPDKPHCYSCW